MRVAATAAAAVMVISMVMPPAASAQHASCSEGSQTNRWRGHSTTDTANQKHGASATAEAHALVQCGTPGLVEISGSMVWSAVAPDNSAGLSVVTVGMGNCRGSACVGGQRYYSAWGRSSSVAGCAGYSNRSPVIQNEGAYVSAPHDFKVHHTSNEWRFYVDATLVHSIAESNICWTGRRAQWFGQTMDLGDQLGGDPGNKLSITSLNYANVEGGGFFWTSFNAADSCNFNNGGAPFLCDVTGTRSIDIWTSR